MKRLIWYAVIYVFLWIALLSVAYYPFDASARSRVPVRQFRQQVECPATGRFEVDTPCKGYVVDHIMPLCAGGRDEPINMQWQEYLASKKKDILELEICRNMKKRCGK